LYFLSGATEVSKFPSRYDFQYIGKKGTTCWAANGRQFLNGEEYYEILSTIDYREPDITNTKLELSENPEKLLAETENP